MSKWHENKEIEQVNSNKYLEVVVTNGMRCSKETRKRKAIEAFNREKE